MKELCSDLVPRNTSTKFDHEQRRIVYVRAQYHRWQTDGQVDRWMYGQDETSITPFNLMEEEYRKYIPSK